MPVVDATIKGEHGYINHVMLIDTSATLSLICSKAAPKPKDFNIQGVKVWEGYSGKESTVPFIKSVLCTMGKLTTRASFGIQMLDGHSILGMDILKKLNFVVNLPNRMLTQIQRQEGGLLIPAAHRVADSSKARNT